MSTRSDVVRAFMERRRCTSGNWQTDGESLMVFGNAIACWDDRPSALSEEERLFIRDSGWRTLTTRWGLSEVLARFGMFIHLDRGDWRIRDGDGRWCLWEGEWTSVEDLRQRLSLHRPRAQRPSRREEVWNAFLDGREGSYGNWRSRHDPERRETALLFRSEGAWHDIAYRLRDGEVIFQGTHVSRGVHRAYSYILWHLCAASGVRASIYPVGGSHWLFLVNGHYIRGVAFPAVVQDVLREGSVQEEDQVQMALESILGPFHIEGGTLVTERLFDDIPYGF